LLVIFWRIRPGDKKSISNWACHCYNGEWVCEPADNVVKGYIFVGFDFFKGKEKE